MKLTSPELAPTNASHLRLITQGVPRLPSRYTRSIYENRYSQARQSERALETREIQRVAQHIVEFFRQAVSALSPVMGHKAASALYKRSVYLNLSKHPWLSTAYGDLPDAGVLLTLQDTVSRQTLSNAQNAVNDLVAIFKELLHNLIGTSLTHRLLSIENYVEAP